MTLTIVAQMLIASCQLTAIAPLSSETYLLLAQLLKMDRIEQCKAMDRLAKTDRIMIRSIAALDVECSAYACGLLAESMVAGDAIAYCKSLPVGSAKWRSAFWTLRYRDRESVIDYIRSVASSGTPSVLAQCYLMCGTSGWPDLLREAHKDRDSKAAAVLPCADESHTTLGDYAADYVRKFGEKNAHKRQPHPDFHRQP